MKACNIENCGRRALARGLCSAHYQRMKSGNLQIGRPIGDKSGMNNPKWRGGASKMPDGRVLIFAPNHPHVSVAGKYVLRYRLVMEKVLGRFLDPSEIVHHINGDCTDDRPENLQVMTQSRHCSLHSKGRKMKRKEAV